MERLKADADAPGFRYWTRAFHTKVMEQRYTYQQDEETWSGRLEGGPGYGAQRESEVELRENLVRWR